MEPLLHFVIPFIAFMLLGVDLRKSFLLSLLALTPDLDALFLVHRSFTHSLVALLAASTPLLLLLYKYRRDAFKNGVMGILSIASHIALDLPAGYTPLLWPLYNYSIWIQTELSAHLGSTLTMVLDARILTEPIMFEVAESLDTSLFTSTGLIAALVVITPLFVKRIGWKIRHA